MGDDEYFASLGGSLMKDLLADLAVGDGDFSLDQLEKELSALDSQLNFDPSDSYQPGAQPPGLSAASLVVSAQEHSGNMYGAMPTGRGSSVDAWSLSLKNFTAMSLEEDFLAADSVRKQYQPQSAQPMLTDKELASVEDYDIQEKQTLTAPPGMANMKNTLDQQLLKPEDIIAHAKPHQFQVSAEAPSSKTAEVQVPVQPPVPQQPVKPQGANQIEQGIPVPAPPGQPNPALANQHGVPIMGVLPPNMQQHNMQHGHPMMMMPPPPHGMHPHMMQPGVPIALPAGMGMMGMPQMNMPAPPPPHMIPGQQQQHPPQQMQMQLPPQKPIFCNPHPAAPAIPSGMILSKSMAPRDVTFVIHAIMKPILREEVKSNDYYSQFMQRRFATKIAPRQGMEADGMSKEVLSRALKSKDWSSDKVLLGHTKKSDIFKPRALIAVTAAPAKPDSENKQRASLWKSRIICDQVYQAMQIVTEIWDSSPPGASCSQQTQPHLMKIMKCLGITMIDKEYLVDSEAIKLFLKLGKGRTLLARILDNALLTPNAVQASLPGVLAALLAGESKADDSDSRVFRAISRVVQTVDFSGACLLSSLYVVQANARAALSSTIRIECLHSLMQKGSATFKNETSKDLKAEWDEAESEFMSMLQTM